MTSSLTSDAYEGSTVGRFDELFLETKMPRPNYLRALEAAWDEMKVWVKDGRFIPENEESIQCFLYHGIVHHLGTAIGVRPKPTTAHTRSRTDRNTQADTKSTHFPDFILGDPKEVAIEIKFARANASILGSCKQDVAKLKNIIVRRVSQKFLSCSM